MLRHPLQPLEEAGGRPVRAVRETRDVLWLQMCWSQPGSSHSLCCNLYPNIYTEFFCKAFSSSHYKIIYLFFFKQWRFNDGMKLVLSYLKHDFYYRQSVVLDSKTKKHLNFYCGANFKYKV